MSAVSNLSGISTNHTHTRSAFRGTTTHNRFQGASNNSRSVNRERAFLSMKAVRFYLLCAAILLSFFMGITVHIISGSDEVQAASLQTHSIHSASAPTGSVQSASAQSASVQQAKQQVIVGSGDTLWSIAEAHASKSQDIRAYIQKIKEVNHLTTSALRAGQVLQLP
jgi:hypothetical protein